MTKKKCKECGKEFEPKNKDQKFCSHPCATKYNRRNNKIDPRRWSYKSEI